MVIIMTKLVFEVVLPLILVIIIAFMPVIIMMGGILIVLSAVKIKIPVKQIICRLINSIARQIWKLIKILLFKIKKWLPKVFDNTKRYCESRGATPALSKMIAILVVIAIVIIII